MNDTPAHTRDILAEIEAEVVHEMEDERPPAGGAGYQTAGALVGLVIGVGGAAVAYGYGLGSLHEPRARLWPFVVLTLIAALLAIPLLGWRELTHNEAI